MEDDGHEVTQEEHALSTREEKDVENQQVMVHVEKGAPTHNVTKEHKKLGMKQMWTILWQVLCVAAIAVNIAAMIMAGPVAMVVAGIFALLVSPVVFVRQMQLQDIESLRDIQKKLRVNINIMRQENQRYMTENGRLEAEAQRMAESKDRLSEFTKQQGSSIDTFLSLVKQNQETIQYQQEHLKVITLQNLFKSIIDSDNDGSGQFSDIEISRLELQLMTMDNIKVDYDNFRNYMKKSTRTINSVLDLVGTIDQDDIPESERIFTVVPPANNAIRPSLSPIATKKNDDDESNA